MTDLLRLTVEGEPVTKGRPRVTKSGHAYTPETTREAEQSIGWLAKAAYRGEPVACPLSVELAFYCGTARRVDTDNLAKLVLDAINGIVFVDDAQVVELTTWKRIDRERPRTEITVRETQ